jgi:hypothetical protein
MQNEDSARAEEAIQQRLSHIGDLRVRVIKPQYGLRSLLLVAALAPVLIWLIYLAAPTVIHAFVPPALTAAQRSMATQQYQRTTPLLVGAIVPAGVLSLASAIAAFIIVRALGEHAKYGVVAAISLCGVSVIIALTVWIAGGGGFHTIATANGADVFAVYAVPMGIMTLVGTIIGWKVAELQ